MRSSAERTAGRAWVALAALLAAGSVLAWWAPAAWLDWQPGRAASEPWRAWTGAFVHWSGPHLGANLLGTAVVAALGFSARVPLRLVLAWAVAWPLTQWGLLLQPALAHYGGLSGVLHAGVTVAGLWLLVAKRGPRRAIGAALLGGMLIKLLLEQPWGPALRYDNDLDIATAPLAHATGAAAGWACAAVAMAWRRQESIKG